MDDRTIAVVGADTGGRIVHWDRGAEALFGHTSDAAIGQRVDLIIPESYRDAHWAGFGRAMASGECNLDNPATNLPTLHRDGGERNLPARLVFLTDARGNAAGAVGVFAAPAGDEVTFGPVLPILQR